MAFQDGKVLIWSCDLTKAASNALNKWKCTELPKFKSSVQHVSWAQTSNMLAVSNVDKNVTIWKENHRGEYVCIKEYNPSQMSPKSE